jgi:hypothetical protein
MEGAGMQTPGAGATVARYSYLFPIGESRRVQAVSPNHSGHVHQWHAAVGQSALEATRSPSRILRQVAPERRPDLPCRASARFLSPGQECHTIKSPHAQPVLGAVSISQRFSLL